VFQTAVIMAAMTAIIPGVLDFITIEAGAMERAMGRWARRLSFKRVNLHRAHEFGWQQIRRVDEATRLANLRTGANSRYQNRSRTVGSHRISSTIEATLLTFGVLTLVNWLWIFWSTPVFSGVGWFGIILADLLITGVIFTVAAALTDRFSTGALVAGILILCMFGGLIWNSMPLKGYSNRYAAIPQVKLLTDPKGPSYPPTSNDNVLLMTPQNALNKANAAMGLFIPHTNITIGSTYDLGPECDLQPHNDTLQYNCGLVLAGTNNNQGDDYTVNGYLAVDAQHPDKPAVPHFGYKMKYTLGAPFEHSVRRLLWDYDRTAFWDNVTLEVMPGGRPMYTMTEDFTPVKWQQSVPEWFVTLDPQTGKITRYHLDNIPGWASRVFSAQMAKLYLTWWGGWQLKPWDKKGSSGRFVVDGDVNLVYTDEGLAWQVLMTPKTNSGTNTSAITYIALMDTRTGHIRAYAAPPGLTTQVTVDHVLDTAGTNLTLSHSDAGAHSIHIIDNEYVWVLPLQPKGTVGTGNPEPSSGVVLLDGTDANGSHVIVDTTLAGALDQLDRAAAAGQIDNNPVAKATKKSVAGVVERVGPPGGAYLVFKLKGDPHFYKVSLSGAASDSDELLLMNPGDDVVVTYNDTGKRDRYVKQVSDLNIEPPVRPDAAPSSSPTVPAGR
jgi:hypothetical protein